MAAVTGRPVADLAVLADLCTPWCVHVAATLRIADLIVSGVTGVGDLAARAGCDADSPDRVLRHLVSKDVFKQTVPGMLGLNELAEGLRGPRPGHDLNGIGGGSIVIGREPGRRRGPSGSNRMT
ncbi:MAG TPA: hypothetical protein VF951_13160 [Streptosporangiaceae bacterium]